MSEEHEGGKGGRSGKYPIPRINPLWLQKYWQDKKFIDLHIYASDRTSEPIAAHQVIIGSVSPNLHQRIDALEEKEGPIQELVIGGVSRDTLEKIVEFIYSGSNMHGLDDDNVLDILVAARRLALNHVVKGCEKYVQHEMKIGNNNVLDVLNNLGHDDWDHKDVQMIRQFLLDACSIFIVTNVHQEFVSLFSVHIIRIVLLHARNTNLCPLKDLLVLLFQWILHNDNRLHHASHLIHELPVQKLGQEIVGELMIKFSGDPSKMSSLIRVMNKLIEAAEVGSTGKLSQTSLSLYTTAVTDAGILTNQNVDKPAVPSKSPKRKAKNILVAKSVLDHPKKDHRFSPIATSTPTKTIPDVLLEGDENTGDYEVNQFDPDFEADEKESSSSSTPSLNGMDHEPISPTSNSIMDEEGRFYFLSGQSISSRKLQSFCLRDMICKPESVYAISDFANSCLAYHDDKIYVLGGQKNGDKTSTEVHVFDLEKRAWSIGPSMKEGRCEFSAIYMDGFIYAVGGDQYVLPESGKKKRRKMTKGSWMGTNTVERLRITSNLCEQSWEYVDWMHNSRHNCALAVLDNRIYAIGGNAAAAGEAMSASNSVESFDPTVSEVDDDGTVFYGAWTMKTPMKARRIGPSLVAAGGQLYALGGGSIYNNSDLSDPHKLNLVEIYDPLSDRWRPGPSMLKTRKYFGSCLFNNSIYAIGGDDDEGSPSIERLDLDQNQWIMVERDDDDEPISHELAGVDFLTIAA